jgi:hypothetical protein
MIKLRAAACGAIYLLAVQAAHACVAGYSYNNPEAHRPYVGDGCVYYGKYGGYIVEGRYKLFIISDELLEGFRDLSVNRPDLAFSQWLQLAALGNRGAQYNIGVMLHLGIGTKPDYVASLDFLFQAMEGLSHYNTANAYSVRVLQEALIGLGYLDGTADGDFGPKTDVAVDAAIQDLYDAGPRENSEYWYYWAIAEKFQESERPRPTEDRGPIIQQARPESGRTSMPAYTPAPQTATDEVTALPVLLDDPSTSLGAPKSLSELYRDLSPSVYLVLAAESLDDFQSFENISQGSAVAVSSQVLATNCHVIDQRPYIIAVQNDVPIIVMRARANESVEKDTCFLVSEDEAFQPVRNNRSYDEIQVGEGVITIGSPKGQENSLSAGLVSGLRTIDSVRHIQITAPISPGSSGGALFDLSGNLLGVTTMGIEDAQAINFAIAIEEFRR